jgi:hypothetical protein
MHDALIAGQIALTHRQQDHAIPDANALAEGQLAGMLVRGLRYSHRITNPICLFSRILSTSRPRRVLWQLIC